MADAGNIPPVAAQGAQGAGAPQQPEPHALVNGEDIVVATDALMQVTSLQQILHWIGFNIEEHRENIRAQSLGLYEEIQSLTEKDCQAIATDWAGRTTQNG